MYKGLSTKITQNQNAVFLRSIHTRNGERAVIVLHCKFICEIRDFVMWQAKSAELSTPNMFLLFSFFHKIIKYIEYVRLNTGTLTQLKLYSYLQCCSVIGRMAP